MKTNHEKNSQSTPPLPNNTSSAASCQQNTLVNNTIRAKMANFKVYSHCVVFQPAKSENPGNTKEIKHRGKITHFSKRSRFRLFEILAKIDNNLNEKPIFCTLTYHHGHQNSKNSTKDQLHNFLTQLRQFDEKVQFIWRTELQSRGAPHYHLIIFPGPIKSDVYMINYEIRVAQIWHEIADPGSYRHKEYGCKLVVINSYREACSYISKYVGKEEKNNTEIIEGKHWGCSRNLPIKVYHKYSAWDDDAKLLITLIRDWMWANGKEKYADPDYVNVHHDFTVFIDRAEFNNIIPDELVYVDDY